MTGRVKGIIAGGAAVVILAAATVAVMMYQPEKENETSTESDKETQTVYENENADRIVVDAGDRETVYLKNGENWTIEGYDESDIDPSKMQSFISDALKYSSATVITEPDQPEEYGLDNPSAKVTITGGDNDAVIEIGGKSAVENSYFAMYNDVVFTIPASQYTKLISEPSYFTEFARVSIEPDNIRELKIESPQRTIDLYIPEITRFEGNVWYMREPYDTMANDSYLDSDVLEQIGALTMSRKGDSLGEERAKLTVVSDDGTTYEFTVGSDDGEYVNIEYNGQVYKESSSLLAFIDADLFNYVNKLVSYVNILDVKSIDMEYDGEKHTIEVSGSDNDLSFKVNGKEADADASRLIYRELIGVVANGFAGDEAAGDTILKVTFNGDNPVTMEYKAINEYNVAAFRNGKALLNVSINDVDMLKEKIIAYFKVVDETAE